MKFRSYRSWLNENKKGKVTILYPGSFKPLHYGHIQLIKSYATHPDVKEVKVLIGPGIRNGIDQKISLKIAEELLASFDNVSIEAVKYPSPILTAYKYIETAEPGIYAMAATRKGKDDEDYKRVLKFVNDFQLGGKYEAGKPKGVTVIELPIHTHPFHYEGRSDDKNGEPISASILRQDILNDDYENFRTNYPDYIDEVVENIWELLKPVVVEGIEQEYEDILNEELNAAEALYGFGGWLTSKDEPVTMSSHHDAGIVAEFIDEFIKKQKLEEPREHWEDELIPMHESKSLWNAVDVKGKIERSKKLSKEMKDKILPLIIKNGMHGTKYNNGVVTKLKYDKSKECDLGADKDGFFVFTHRARSKSYSEVDKIPQKDIKFIESTG